MFHSTAHVPSHGTLLFVPADRPDRIPKALDSGARAVAVDLEDAVDAVAKDAARDQAAGALQRISRSPGGPATYLRINGIGTEWADDDVAAAAALTGRIDGVVVPKAEDPAELVRLTESMPDGLVLLPILETARGVLAAREVAVVPRVRALVFGTLDLATELGVSPSVEGRELLHARSQLVLASAAAGLQGPVDGPHAALDDLDGLARSAAAARDLGFTGKIVLHPRQIATVRDAFAPTEAELEQARRVIDAYRGADGAGAVKLADGTFVDRPVMLRAAALLGIAPEDLS